MVILDSVHISASENSEISELQPTSIQEAQLAVIPKSPSWQNGAESSCRGSPTGSKPDGPRHNSSLLTQNQFQPCAPEEDAAPKDVITRSFYPGRTTDLPDQKELQQLFWELKGSFPFITPPFPVGVFFSVLWEKHLTDPTPACLLPFPLTGTIGPIGYLYLCSPQEQNL